MRDRLGQREVESIAAIERLGLGTKLGHEEEGCSRLEPRVEQRFELHPCVRGPPVASTIYSADETAEQCYEQLSED